MTTEIKKICRLCFGSVDDGVREKIDDIQREMLDVLLIQVDWSLCENPVLCGQCLIKIQDLFAFKSNCVDIEDYLTPFKTNEKLDLQSVYEKKDAQELSCRLCLEVTDGSDVRLDETDLEKCKLYLPEIDLELTKKFVICSKCYSSLQNYLNFTERCMKNEQILCDYSKMIRKRGTRPILLEKFSEYLTEMSLPLSSVHQFNGKRKRRSKKLDEYTCEFCSYKSHSVTYIRQHTLFSHLDLPDTELFKCTMCPLQTKYKGVLNKHMNTTHSDHRYCCSECSFKTKHKISLTRHVTIHKEPTIHECELCHFTTRHLSTIERHVCKVKKVKKVLQCPNCPYKSTRSNTLKLHSLRHKSPSEIHMYQCDFCNFKSKLKTSVTRHMLVHQKPEQTAYKCPYCQYDTFSTWSLNIHIKTHDNSYNLKNMKKEEYLKKVCEQSYKCTKCSFVTANNRVLSRHITMTHSNVKPVYKKRKLVKVKKEEHECAICGYKTLHKFHFGMHLKTHLNSSEARTHKCDQCSFQTNWASSLINHKNLHKDPSEVAMFQCPMCTFKTMHRKSIIAHKKVRHSFTTKTYKCKKCPFQTKWLASMRNHQTVHGPAELKCTKCSFRTRYSRSLRNHLRDLHKPSVNTGTNETIVPEKEMMQCADCMCKFADKGNMIRHIRNIHGKGVPKLYKCNKCPYVTKWGSSMGAHKIVHKDKESLSLFECNLCDFKSKYKRVLKNHISNRHEMK